MNLSTLSKKRTNLLYILIAVVVIAASFSITLALSSGGIFAREEVDVLHLNIQPVFGVIADKNLTIISIEKGSAAEKAGIKPGDGLVAVYGIRVKSFTEAATIVDTIRGRVAVRNTPPQGLNAQQQAEADAAQAKTDEVLRQQNQSLERIRNSSSGQITIRRGKDEITLNLQLTAPLLQPNQPTPTPVPENQLYF